MSHIVKLQVLRKSVKQGEIVKMSHIVKLQVLQRVLNREKLLRWTTLLNYKSY